MLQILLISMLAGASLQLTDTAEPAEEPRKLKYKGPVVYSNLPPPILYFPSFPPDPKISSRGDAQEKTIEYVPYPYENLPLLVYQSGNQPPVHVVQKSSVSTPSTQSKDNVKVQQQSSPDVSEISDNLKSNRQQYQNSQSEDETNSDTAPQLFPDFENHRFVSIGISTYNTELPNNVLYSVPQPAISSGIPQKQNTVPHQVSQNIRSNPQQQPAYTISQNNAQQQMSYIIAQKGPHQSTVINSNLQTKQYTPNAAVQQQVQNVQYGQVQSNFKGIPDQTYPSQNNYGQPAAVGYSEPQNYGQKQFPVSIQQILRQQTGGEKNSYQYSNAPMSPNSQSSIQQQGAVQDTHQIQKVQVQVQPITENTPDDETDQQFLSIALYPYDIRGNNYKDEEKQFYKIVVPQQEGEQLGLQGQSFQHMKMGNNEQYTQTAEKQTNYPSITRPIAMQKQQANVIEKPRAMIMQHQSEMQRQQAMGIQKQREMEMQKQKEMVIQRQHEIQMQRQHVLGIQKQRETEMQRQQVMGIQKQGETVMQKQKAMALQLQHAMEMHKQKMMDVQRQQMMAKQKSPENQKSNTEQKVPEKSPESDDATEYQQILIHIPHSLATQPQIVVQKGDTGNQAVNSNTGKAQASSPKNDTAKLSNTPKAPIRPQSFYTGTNKRQIIPQQNFKGPANSNFFKEAEFINLPNENPAVKELIRNHYSYLESNPIPSYHSRHPGAFSSSNYHFTRANPFSKNTFRSAPTYSFVEPPSLLQSASKQYHNIFSVYPDELLAESSFQSPTYIPLIQPGQNAMSVVNSPQLQTVSPGPIKISAAPPLSSFGPKPRHMVYGNRNVPPPSSVLAGSSKYGNFIKKLTTLSNIVLSQSLGMKSQITSREENKEADEYKVEEVDDVPEDMKKLPEDSDNVSAPKQKLTRRISKPTEDTPLPPIIVYKGPKPPVEIYGTKDDIEKGKSSQKKAGMKQTNSKIDRNDETDFDKTMYSILPKFVKRSTAHKNNEDESDSVDSELEEGNPPIEGAIIDELEAFVDSFDETNKKEVPSKTEDSIDTINSSNQPTFAVNEDIEDLMKLLHKEEKSHIFSS